MKNILIVLLAAFIAACNSGNVKTLNTRDKVTLNYMFLQPEKPVATVLLFAGGHGNLGISGGGINWGRNNFLIRSRHLFKEQGFNVVLVDAPSDRKQDFGMGYGYRNSKEHRRDVDAIIADVRKISNVPVWLVGTSRGTESVAYLGIESKQKPDGLVLTSSMTEENGRGEPITALSLQEIKMPVLVMAHKADECSKTPPEGADTIASMLVGSEKVGLKFYTGGDEPESHPCRALSAHGFLGIEEKVIKDIADFIKSN